MRFTVTCLAILTFAACGERFEGSYRTAKEAREAVAAHKSRIPSMVPDGASNIHEYFDIDTNEVWGAFGFQASEAEPLRSQLRPVTPSELTGKELRVPAVSWWLEPLSGEIDPERLRRSGLEVYKYDQQQAVVYFLAIDWPENRAYFWTYAR